MKLLPAPMHLSMALMFLTKSLTKSAVALMILARSLVKFLVAEIYLSLSLRLAICKAYAPPACCKQHHVSNSLSPSPCSYVFLF